MNVIQCSDTHREAWNAFVGSAPAASFYHRYEWRTINAECFGHRSAYLAAMHEGRMLGILPIVQVKSRLFGNIACSLPFVNYGGPCAQSPDAQAALMRAAEALCEEWGVEYLEVRSRHHLGDRFPVSQHKVSLTLSLEADPDLIWKGFKSGHRQDIRRGYKNGFSARVGGAELCDDFFDVLAESWRDLGTPIYQRSYIRRIAETFEDQVRLCVVYADGVPAAAAFDGVHGETVEGMWLGTRARHRAQYAGYVLYWEVIKDACERGFRTFHLGRSSAESGAEAFKKKWNAEARPLYWHYVLRGRRDIPQLNTTNRKYRLAIAAWRRLPVSVSERVGPLIARSIP